MGSKYQIIKFSHDELEATRKEYNMDTEEKREEVFRILEEWLLKQDHFTKKTYSRDYLERCIWSCNGSIEKTKLQIDRMCTMRTLLPNYFQISNINEIKETFKKCYIGISPKLTKQFHRFFMFRIKPNIDISSEDCENIFKQLIIGSEFMKSIEISNRYTFVFDFSEANMTDVITKFNLLDLQQILPILTAGYGCKVQGVIFITPSKLIEVFINIIKPIFKEKIRKRIHVATTRDHLKDFLQDDIEVLPVEYGGNEKPLQELHDDAFATFSSEPVQELLKEMNMARTDESKRQTDKFNGQYMGMAGTFRTISLD